MEEQHVYAAIGHAGFDRLADAFYRQVPSDNILGPMYPAQDLEGAQQRLRDFLIFRFGGPAHTTSHERAARAVSGRRRWQQTLVLHHGSAQYRMRP